MGRSCSVPRLPACRPILFYCLADAPLRCLPLLLLLLLQALQDELALDLEAEAEAASLTGSGSVQPTPADKTAKAV